jgi:hypothetical protein
LFSAKTLKIAVGPVLTDGALVREHVRIQSDFLSGLPQPWKMTSNAIHRVSDAIHRVCTRLLHLVNVKHLGGFAVVNARWIYLKVR